MAENNTIATLKFLHEKLCRNKSKASRETESVCYWAVETDLTPDQLVVRPGRLYGIKIIIFH